MKKFFVVLVALGVIGSSASVHASFRSGTKNWFRKVALQLHVTKPVAPKATMISRLKTFFVDVHFVPADQANRNLRTALIASGLGIAGVVTCICVAKALKKQSDVQLTEEDFDTSYEYEHTYLSDEKSEPVVDDQGATR